MIAGVEAPDGGRIGIDGITVFGPGVNLPPEARGVGLMFQDFALFPHLTVAGNIAFGLRGDKAAKQARVEELLEKVNLSGFAAKHPHELSGGEQQRVALARALAPRPRRDADGRAVFGPRQPACATASAMPRSRC